MRLLITAISTIAMSAGTASAVTVIDSQTQGLYNAGIGQALDGTSPFEGSLMFPPEEISGGDPSLDIPAGSPPDLSNAAGELGGWLGAPASPGGNWSGSPMSIPSQWSVNSETAIIYEIDAGISGLNNVLASFGVDNGVFVWLNGVFQGGHLRPGSPILGEYEVDIGSLSPGSHYLQVLREDHGGATGYEIEVTGDVQRTRSAIIPLPATLPLIAGGLAVLFAVGARRRS